MHEKDGKCTNQIPFYKNSAPVRVEFKNIWKCLFWLFCHVQLAIAWKQNPY